MDIYLDEESRSMEANYTPDCKIVRLITTETVHDANMLHNALVDDGVYCEVVGDYLTSGLGLGVLPGIHPEIWVRETDLKKAQHRLHQHEKHLSKRV